MFDRVSPPAGCGRSVLLGRPPGSWQQRLTGGLQELAAVVPHRGSVAAGVPARVRRVLGVASMRGGGVSGGGERVVAELGQDLAGLPDNLAGLRQGGALAVLEVL